MFDSTTAAPPPNTTIVPTPNHVHPLHPIKDSPLRHWLMHREVEANPMSWMLGMMLADHHRFHGCPLNQLQPGDEEVLRRLSSAP